VSGSARAVSARTLIEGGEYIADYALALFLNGHYRDGPRLNQEYSPLLAHTVIKPVDANAPGRVLASTSFSSRVSARILESLYALASQLARSKSLSS
jgi:hypothetical protein